MFGNSPSASYRDNSFEYSVGFDPFPFGMSGDRYDFILQQVTGFQCFPKGKKAERDKIVKSSRSSLVINHQLIHMYTCHPSVSRFYINLKTHLI